MLKSIPKTLETALLTAVAWLASVSVALAQGAQGQVVTLANPLRVNTITELLAAILNIVIVLAVPIIVFFIIYAGFLYVTAKGNAQQIEQATRSLTYAIIGGVLVLGAVAIAEIISNLVQSF
ncbi:hypothetical protein A3I99_00530 [Candidatus Kaiserbacteria bacterium RIFCSPLOWO2_02_FULL_45_11b]|uniref:Uncharacterized protein n=1 Tax=Candidatus Kaiserbacteria bacterium RIFCSPLOWO2_12_FULL_45_26 TaxID=1798525 RepID=A0A1F6FGA0_9BACT|nr:MAG: hypothetical protein A2Z56_00805 [Candidatus Kaiserbacteria bacterium RIFCSPHIGHO2_12_45_16]OGG70932.1 MAG: hypothetical protein A2929_00940 [Candidatus Kaiserbacteria bacterium RIFCSPLOWO2_01_FULL_45_25]OGG84262.1 MAG: hypothetical protein A3I99_00530 [Candidatus Kaiserbacteria bacterium RIFCSPLOWO2_02_FULL_45_11b]OGG84884.1 MAG: hypothetical protein A3G90_02305 [Candidatus Kaiserbacteria bacterium RIFCSPLOWO2_12_FULL_45_26]